MSEPPDAILIERAHQGDENAVASLYRRYAHMIARYVGYRVSDLAAVEDLTAEVFLQMVEALPRYRVTGAPFEAWLYRIASARVADYYRHRERYALEELDERLDGDRTPLELDVQQGEELAELRAALGQLSVDHQTILILRFVERKSHREVAQIMDKSVRAVATAQHRALKRLAELLQTDKTGRHYLRGNRREQP
jgi:RNA polymerase sigma-70 factor (ECF subfamily)